MIIEFDGIKPKYNESCFIADSAVLVGKVVLKENASIWYNSVLRGDANKITIGKDTNIQDGCVIHASEELETVVGDCVTVGHKAILHACKIGDNVLVGMGSIILDGSEIEDNVIVGAGSVVTPDKKIPSGSLVLGSPARVVRKLTDDEIAMLKASAEDYVNYAKKHKKY